MFHQYSQWILVIGEVFLFGHDFSENKGIRQNKHRVFIQSALSSSIKVECELLCGLIRVMIGSVNRVRSSMEQHSKMHVSC